VINNIGIQIEISRMTISIKDMSVKDFF